MIEILRRKLVQYNKRRTTDVYFIGYPKVGNTWVRYMLGQYGKLTHNLPDLPLFDYYDSLGRCERVPAWPGIHFTHDPLRWEYQTDADLSVDNVIYPYRGKKKIILVRYPLDALVSFYFYDKHKSNAPSPKDLYGFINDPVFGLRKLLHFYNLWAKESRTDTKIMFLRYEDMRIHPSDEFKKLLGFIGIEKNTLLSNSAVELSSFENMKKAEIEGSITYKSSGHEIFGGGDKRKPEGFHVRKGKIAGFREYLPDDKIAELNDIITKNFDPVYGYRSGNF